VKVKNLILFLGGILFGFGLAIGGMSKPEIVLSFLLLKDLGLIVLMAAATITASIAINIIPKFIKKPIFGDEYKKRTRILNRPTIVGAIIFGIGWGISGQCPGSALSSLGVGNIPILIGITTMFLGAYVMAKFFGN
jgi:uncharacterized membrane protein YedE/YeeE